MDLVVWVHNVYNPMFFLHNYIDQYIVHIDGRKETSWTLEHWSSHQQALVETSFESDNLLWQNWELLSQVRKSQIFFQT